MYILYSSLPVKLENVIRNDEKMIKGSQGCNLEDRSFERHVKVCCITNDLGVKECTNCTE